MFRTFVVLFGYLLFKEFTEFCAFQLFDSFVEYFLIGLETDVDHESALLAAKHITRPADIQVPHGDLEAAAQIAVLLEGLKPFA